MTASFSIFKWLHNKLGSITVFNFIDIIITYNKTFKGEEDNKLSDGISNVFFLRNQLFILIILINFIYNLELYIVNSNNPLRFLNSVFLHLANEENAAAKKENGQDRSIFIRL